MPPRLALYQAVRGRVHAERKGSKLKMAIQEQLGQDGAETRSLTRSGNPRRSPLVESYVVFTGEEQKKRVEVAVNQAEAIYVAACPH